jgi:diguanylate cyclase (GGDEF)-like protein
MNALRQHQALSIRTGESFCVALVDIDFFKNINDTLGHSAGDTVLREFSASAMRSLRASDQFGRWGGEEFMLLMPQTSMQEAITGAQRLRLNTEALSFPVGEDLALTISIGLAQYRVGEDIEDTLRRADVALYRAKSAGRNRVEYELGEGGSVAAPAAG